MKRLVIFLGIFLSLIMKGHSIGFKIGFIEQRNTYLVGEPLILYCNLYNTGSDTAYIDIDDLARMIIINSKGDTLKAKLRIFVDRNYVAIPPGDTISDIFNFNGGRYGTLILSPPPSHRCAIPPGEYTIKIWNYMPKKLKKRGEFMITEKNSPENCDVIESNTIRMRIEEPTGREKEAWEILKAIYQRVRISKNVDQITRLLNEYADTRYAPAVFEAYIISMSNLYIRKYGFNIYGKQDGVEIAKEFIKRYPKSGVGAFLNLQILNDCYEDIKKGKYDEAMKIYNEMLKKYKGTPVEWGIKCGRRELKAKIKRTKILKQRGWKR